MANHIRIGDKISSIDNQSISTAKETEDALQNSEQSFEMELRRIAYDKGLILFISQPLEILGL